MKKARRGWISAVLAGLLLLYALLFSCLQWAMADRDYYTAESRRLQTHVSVGLSAEEAGAALWQMVSYMEGDAPVCQVETAAGPLFQEKEQRHMEDVRALYQGFALARTLALGLSALLMLSVLLRAARPLRRLGQGYLLALGILALLALGLGLWIALDFSSFWNLFHRLLFRNDLWRMDPAESRMILLCPPELFSGMIARFALRAGLCALLPAALSLYFVLRRPRTGKRQAAA